MACPSPRPSACRCAGATCPRQPGARGGTGCGARRGTRWCMSACIVGMMGKARTRGLSPALDGDKAASESPGSLQRRSPLAEGELREDGRLDVSRQNIDWQRRRLAASRHDVLSWTSAERLAPNLRIQWQGFSPGFASTERLFVSFWQSTREKLCRHLHGRRCAHAATHVSSVRIRKPHSGDPAEITGSAADTGQS